MYGFSVGAESESMFAHILICVRKRKLEAEINFRSGIACGFGINLCGGIVVGVGASL